MQEPAPGALNTFVIRWSSVSNRTYVVQRATNLMTAFAAVATNAASPPENTYTGALDAAARYYRVRVQRP